MGRLRSARSGLWIVAFNAFGIPNEVEGSRHGILKVTHRDPSASLRVAQDDSFWRRPIISKLGPRMSASLDITKSSLFVLAIGLVFASLLPAQEPSPSPSPTATPDRSVRISFVPPPLDGKISLGIYDQSGRLVRVLQQEADFDQFTIGADALSTKWDGKDDDERDLPGGKYSARGFLVAPMKIGPETVAATPSAITSVHIKLVANPLENNERPTIDLTAGFDDDDVLLETTDGLPLVTIAKRGDASTVGIGPGRDPKTIIVFLGDGTNTRQLEVSGLSKMMAFDCGRFELK
jgi:hypothetical protein